MASSSLLSSQSNKHRTAHESARSLRVALEEHDSNVMPLTHGAPNLQDAQGREHVTEEEHLSKRPQQSAIAAVSEDADTTASNSEQAVHSVGSSSNAFSFKTATYPQNLPQKNQLRRFARSAQKRQSVQLLGSIEHLQHHFMKFGLAAEETPNVRGISSTPAIGSSLHHSSSLSSSTTASHTHRTSQLGLPSLSDSSSTIGSTSGVPLPATLLAPQPIQAPTTMELPKVDLGVLKREAMSGVKDVRKVWSLAEANKDQEEDEEDVSVDVLDLLQTTVRAIRAIRAYSLAAPISDIAAAAQHQHQQDGGGGSLGGRRQQRPSLSVLGVAGGRARHSISTPSRPAFRVVSLGGGGVGSTSTDGDHHPTDAADDPLKDVRKAALEVLAGLRAVEERLRVEDTQTGPLPEATSSSSIGPASSSDNTPSFGTASSIGDDEDESAPPVSRGGTSVSSASRGYVDDEGYAPAVSSHDGFLYDLTEDDEHAAAFGQDESERKESWMDKIMDSRHAGGMYREDAEVHRDLIEERKLVARYLECVERSVLPAKLPAAAGGSGGRRGLGLGRRRVSAEGRLEHNTKGNDLDDMGLDDVTEESETMPTPEWVRRDWQGKGAERLHGFLAHHLPLGYIPLLPHPTSDGFELALLTRLSDGYLLASAFNDVIVRSPARWGMIPHEDINDTLDDGGKDWTFRKIRNLIAWAAAIKLRYALPISLPQHGDAKRVQHLVPLQQTYQGGQAASTLAAAETTTMMSRTSSSSGGKSGAESIAFDPAAVAKRATSSGWDASLLSLCSAWLDHIVAESYRTEDGV